MLEVVPKTVINYQPCEWMHVVNNLFRQFFLILSGESQGAWGSSQCVAFVWAAAKPAEIPRNRGLMQQARKPGTCTHCQAIVSKAWITIQADTKISLVNWRIVWLDR